MPEILLLALKGNEDSLSTFYDENLYEFKSRNKLWNTPNLGLLTVGKMLQKKYSVEYLDLNYDTLKSYNYKYAFISPSTSQALMAYELAAQFRRKGIKVAMGGPHVSMLPDEALQYADIVFAGESEDTIDIFLENEMETLYSSNTNPNMEKSPVPLYELAVKYPYTSIPVQLSRGCPHQCEFCLSSAIYGKKIRRKRLIQVREELLKITSLYKNPFIFFTDDNFFINQEYALQVLEILEELNLKWYAFTDIAIYKKGLILKRLYQSGCRKLLIGFESLNERNLKDINKSGFKSSKRNEYKTSIQTIQKEKIGVIGSFVLGLDKDNENTFDELYRFILDTRIFGTNITISTPFPGTKLYSKLKHQQDINKNWSLYDGFTPIYEIPSMSQEALKEKYKELIEKINSKERFTKVIDFFKEQTL